MTHVLPLVLASFLKCQIISFVECVVLNRVCSSVRKFRRKYLIINVNIHFLLLNAKNTTKGKDIAIGNLLHFMLKVVVSADNLQSIVIGH